MSILLSFSFPTHTRLVTNSHPYCTSIYKIYPLLSVSFAVAFIQFSSVTQSCPTLCNCMNCRVPGLHVHHQLPDFQTHVHWVGDAIQPSHPLSSPPPPAFNLSQYQDLFKWVSSSHQVAKVLELQSVLTMNIQNLFSFGFTGLISLQSKGLSRVYSNTTVQQQ